MMRMTYTKRFFKCDCGPRASEFSVEHLFEDDVCGTFGPWYCDNCQHTWSLREAGKSPTKSELPMRKKQGVLLKLDYDPKRDGDLFVLVDGSKYRDFHTGGFSESEEYFYEQHQCPSNIFRDVVDVIVGEDNDMHGLFRLADICTEPIPDFNEKDEYITENFGHHFKGGDG